MGNADTLGVLKQLERGEISAAQANEQLNAPPQIEQDHAPTIEQMEKPQWVQKLWFYPLVAGILLVGLGTWIIAATVHANILWFLLGLPIVLLGSFIVALAASARSGHWLYVSIQASGKHRHNIRFGMPFPLGLVRLGLWIAQRAQPVAQTRINVSTSRTKFDGWWEDPDALIHALERELSEGRGITVDVDDNDERVQVYIV